MRSSTGADIPLSALITTRYVASPKMMTRFNGFPAVKVTGNPAPGFSSGQAIRAMEETANETLPGDFAYAWAGQALQEKGAGSTSSSAFIFGLIVVFLLLAAQFEKWTLPIAVVLTVPFAVLGCPRRERLEQVFGREHPGLGVAEHVLAEVEQVNVWVSAQERVLVGAVVEPRCRGTA